MQDLTQIHSEVQLVRERNPGLSDDNAFVYWFLSAYLLDSDNSDLIKSCIVGAKGDINVDAFHIDHPNKKIFLVQAKYHDTSSKAESRDEIISFLALEDQLYDKDKFENLLTNANDQTKLILADVHKKLTKQKYDLDFLFVSTGKIAKDLKTEMINRPKWAHVQLFDAKALIGLMIDYLEGAAPPVPYIEIPTDDKQLIMHYSPETNITNYIFFSKTESIRSVYEKYEIKLFARNIRGFLGETSINKKIQSTLTSEPEYFIYLNNGITIICDNAKSYTHSGQTIIRIDNPQIINGQQTTRVIALEPSENARVLVRVVSIPKESDEDIASFSGMVNKIVASTNYQNAIKPSDLRSNDKEQIRIEKEFRKYGYHYVRKRMAKTEEKHYFSQNFRFKVDRHNLVKAISATIYDPNRIRKGVEHLYEDDATYRKIFANRPAKEYLLFYWFHRLVQSGSNAQRYYSIWYVLNEIYSLTRNLFGSKTNRDAFIYVCERQNKLKYNHMLQPLRKIVDHYFDLYVKDFFRHSKRTSEEYLDMSSFFNSQGLCLKFEKFFKRHVSKKRKESIRNNLKQFEKEILGFEYPE